MKILPASAGQAVYHDFIAASTTWVAAKRLYAGYVIDARLDLGRLDRAVRRVVALHDSLRTAIEWHDGSLVQVIREPSEIHDPVLDRVRWDGTANGAAVLITGLDDWWTVPRPLAIRVLAGHGPASQTLVVCAFNHASSDGISAELVFEQIRQEYEADEPRLRSEDVVQFAEYYEQMLREGMHAACQDWVRLLPAVAPAVPQWMVEQKLAIRHAHIANISRSFSKPAARCLDAVARRTGCTRFEVLAAATGLYFRRPDQQPAAIGVIHSGRDRSGGFEVTGLVRSFVIDLVDHLQVATIGDAPRARRDKLRAAIERYAALPFEEACRQIGQPPGWRAGQRGFWEVEINCVPEGPITTTMGGGRIRVLDASPPEEADSENGGPTFVLSYVLAPNHVWLQLRHVSPPVHKALAERVADCLEAIVCLMHDSPATPVDQVAALFRDAETVLASRSTTESGTTDR